MTIADEAARPCHPSERSPFQRSARLSGLDAGFLALELREQPMHNLALAVLRSAGGEGKGRVTLDDVRRHLACRLDALPAFRLRVQPIPFGLHQPVFVEASDFDLHDHLGGATLPAPGGSQELDRLCASLAGRCLDRHHPLWHLTLVNGLDGGRQALVLEIHHCLMDGAAMLTTFSRLFSSADAQYGNLHRKWRPECPPSRWRLVVDAIVDQSRMLTGLPALVRKTKRGANVRREIRAGSAIVVPRPRADTPLCSLNAGFTAERRYARAALSLASIKLVKDIAGVTVNDVVLSVVAGALRDYLEKRHDLPDRPLVANVPVGMETSDDLPREVGNRITRLVTSLATNVAEPWPRLQTISAVTCESKRCLDLVGREVMGEWLDLVPPAIARAAVRRDHRRRRRRPDHLDTNVTISNVRGPAQPWSFGPTVIEEMYITAPPNSGVGVTFVVWDYAGTLLVGILSFADSVEDPGELASGLSRSLNELVIIARDRREKSAVLSGGFAHDDRLVTGEIPGIGAMAPTRLAVTGAPAGRGNHL